MENKFHLNCPVCKQRFNKKAREPIYMQCCAETACKNCVLFKMTTNDEAKAQQDAKEMLISNFECALCKKKHFSPKGLETNLPVQVNLFALKSLEQYDG